MYEIKNLSLKIGKKNILKNINLEIKERNFLTILGANACGKTTLLRAINGNIANYKGKIHLENKDISSYCPKHLASKRAVLSQAFSFSYSFKLHEVIELGFFASELNKNEKDKVLEIIYDRLELFEIKNMPYQSLSGGQKQKVQLARILVQIYASKQKQKYLLLDEPTLNLDVHYQYKILDLVKDLVQELGLGVCAVLHDLNQAFLYSDEIAMIKDGKIKYFGKAKEVLNPCNIFEIFRIKSDFVYSKSLKKDILVLAS